LLEVHRQAPPEHQPLQQSPLAAHGCPYFAHPPASALFASPKQANAMPASPTPNFFNAARRVTDCARLFVSSSNLLFILYLSLWFFCSAENLRDALL
jgi:hypothetical protein